MFTLAVLLRAALNEEPQLDEKFGIFYYLHQNSSLFTLPFGEKVLTIDTGYLIAKCVK